MCQNFAQNINTQRQQQSYGDIIGSDEPQFITKGHLYRAVVGDTIVLPCKVKNLGSFVLLWRRGAAVLTAQNLMVTRDARFKIVDGYNLQISNVKITDGGDYVCQIGDVEPKDQVHTLEILVPPTVKSVPEHGIVSARQGGSATLECKASGNPTPHVSWFRKVNKISFFIVCTQNEKISYYNHLKCLKTELHLSPHKNNFLMKCLMRCYVRWEVLNVLLISALCAV